VVGRERFSLQINLASNVIAALRTFEKACALKLKRQRHGEPSGMGRSETPPF
jgi:hypothetical protein